MSNFDTFSDFNTNNNLYNNLDQFGSISIPKKPHSTKILCIFDGFGLNVDSPNNAISRAKMPNFRRLLKENFWTTLSADGEQVGQEAGLVGNSEVGHMNIGGLKLVPQLSFQITKSIQNAFDLDQKITPDQLFDPKKFLENRWNIDTKFPFGKGVDALADGVFVNLPYNPNLKEKAAELRKSGNLSEVLLWNKIKNGQLLEMDFTRQQIIGDFIVDFYCPKLKLAIEIDGQSHESKGKYDLKRESFLKNLELEIIHFSDSEIKNDLANVVESLYKLVELKKNTPSANASTPLEKGNLESENLEIKNKTIHLIGLFSTGCIHSDLRHWIGVIEASLLAGSEKIVLHLMTDGRDSDKKSLVATWQNFVESLEQKIENTKSELSKNKEKNDLKKLENWQNKIWLGSVGGRFFGMDRDKNWDRVMLGLNCLFDHHNIIINSDIYFQSKYNIKPQEIRNIFSDKVDAMMNKNLDIKYPENYENLGQLDKIKEDLAFYSQKNYKEGNFDENILPVFFSDCNITKNETVWLINFRSDRMKQFGQMLCDLNTEFELNLTILANNSFGIKLETFLNAELEFDEKINRFSNMPDYDYQKGQYYPIFKPQTVKNTLAETISKIPKNQNTNFKNQNSTGEISTTKKPDKSEIIMELLEIKNFLEN